MSLLEENNKNKNIVYTLCGIATIIVIIGTIFDIVMGSVLGSDLSEVVQTAVVKFDQLQDNWLLGLYNLDILNFIITIFMIPTYVCLYVIHNRDNIYAKLALVIFIVGATIFLTNNIALPMLELSNNYAATTVETQKGLYTAAGETMLARGGHGTFGAFPGFVLLTVASIVMSYAMLKGKIFSKTNSYIGIIGGLMLLIYLVLVTFVPDVKSLAIIFATPGGILSLTWMIMFTVKVFKLKKDYLKG